MPNKYHLRLQHDQWCLLQDGSPGVIRSFWTKKEGTSYALSFVERYGGSLVIHRLDGSFQEEHSYPGLSDLVAA